MVSLYRCVIALCPPQHLSVLGGGFLQPTIVRLTPPDGVRLDVIKLEEEEEESPSHRIGGNWSRLAQDRLQAVASHHQQSWA